MKKIYFLTLLFSLISPQAKFASWVKNIPCHGIELQVKSCSEMTFSNLDIIAGKLSKEKEIKIKGAVVKGELFNMTPVSCYPKQKLDLSKFKPADFRNKTFLILNAKCAGLENKEVFLRVTKSFCDTPRAVEIRSCFYNMFQAYKKIIITERIDKFKKL